MTKYLRFTLWHRIEHWLFMASFTTLGITGLVQKFADAPVSISLIRLFGGIEGTRLIHHAAATLMMILAVYHLGAVGYRLFVLRLRFSMLPSLSDAKAAIQALLYNLGAGKTAPQQGRYTFEEKVEYWAVIWGTVIMAITGFMMWNPIATARLLPGQFIPAAKAAHGGEALLAVLAIIIWHLYGVLIKHRNKSMFNGYLSEEEMLHEHPRELADIKAGLTPKPVDPKVRARRLRIFIPSYGVVAAVLLLGVYLFVTKETTAVAIAPAAENIQVYVPLTPTPLPTPIPSPTSAPTPTTVPGQTPQAVQASTWDGGVSQLFKDRCSTCHNSTAKLGGLDFSTYEGVVNGVSKNGPVVISGDPQASSLVSVQAAGGHAGQFSQDELAMIIAWIQAGAPEK